MLHILFTYCEIRLYFTKIFFARDITTDISRKIQIFAVRYGNKSESKINFNNCLKNFNNLLKKIIDFLTT